MAGYKVTSGGGGGGGGAAPHKAGVLFLKMGFANHP